MSLPIVALVGRPNVGKSTFFNRLVGRPQAIVEDEPGTTRDRNYGQVVWNNKAFMVVDTGGIDFGDDRDITRAIRRQAEMAIEEADLIVLMVDANEGIMGMDQDVADVLRRSGKEVILAANKAEGVRRRQNSTEFYSLGLGDPIPISGMQGLNTGDLLDEIAFRLPQAEEEEVNDVPRITLVGRPNVGKSSLLNALLQQDRALVSPIPGTTRDSTDTEIEHEGQPLILVDTAGIRKRGHIEQGVERYSVMRSMRAISRADVAVLVIDATEPLAAQDAHIAGYAWEAFKGLVVVVNKWDLVVPKDDHTLDQYTRQLQRELHFLKDVPMVFTSALTRQRVRKILDLALQVHAERVKRIATGPLNHVIQEALKRHQPMSSSGRMLRLRYVTQVQVRPPTFVLFVNDPERVHFSYRRFLENQLREQFGFAGTAIRLVFRSSREAPIEEPAASNAGGRAPLGSTPDRPAMPAKAAPAQRAVGDADHVPGTPRMPMRRSAANAARWVKAQRDRQAARRSGGKGTPQDRGSKR